MRHESNLSSNMRPDFIFIKASAPNEINLLYASFVVEIQSNLKTLDDEHLGKLVLYNEEVLNSNPSRIFVTSVLTNLRDMVVIKSESISQESQTNVEEQRIIHRISKTIKFWSHGVKYIKQMYNSPETAGYDENKIFSIQISRWFLLLFLFFLWLPSFHWHFTSWINPVSIFSEVKNQPIKHYLHKLIGKGVSARAYSLSIASDNHMKVRHDLVAKIFDRTNKKTFFENEQDIMDEIANRQKISKSKFIWTLQFK